MLESFCTDDRLASCAGSGGKLVLVVSWSLPLKCCRSSKLRSILTTSVGGLVWVDVLWMSGGGDIVWAVASLLHAWVVGWGALMPLALGSLAVSGLLQLEPDTVRVPSTASWCTGLVVLWG